jgi:hypothetical protein
MFLNRLLGRPLYEGFDPAKATAAGRARNFIQIANLPVVLMEGDRDNNNAKASKFDFDELKPLYNGRSARTTGVKNNGTETHEPPFRASIVIEQNRPVKADPAVMQRICHVFMTCDRHSTDGKTKADKLTHLDVNQLSYFVLAATRAEAKIMAHFAERMPVHEQQLMKHPKISNVRLAKNHAQLMAMTDALELVVPQIAPWREAILKQIEDMTVERHAVIGSDHPIVSEFWDRFEHLNDGITFQHLNHSKDDNLIAVNLHEFLEAATERFRDVPTLRELKEHLPTSKKHKFLDSSRVVNSARSPNPKKPHTVRCWVFQRNLSH